MGSRKLNNLDIKILKLLQEDATRPTLEISRICDVPGKIVHDRKNQLRSIGVIEGTELIVNPSSLGFEICSLVRFRLENKDRIDEVVKKVKAVPEVVDCYSTIDSENLLVKIYAYNAEHLTHLIQDKFLSLGEISMEYIADVRHIFTQPLPITPTVDSPKAPKDSDEQVKTHDAEDFKFVDDIIERRKDIEKASIEALTKMANFLESRGVSRLGLWSDELKYEEPQEPIYTKGDKKIFQKVSAPHIAVEFGGDDIGSYGLLYGVEVENGKLTFVGYDQENENGNVLISQECILDREWNINDFGSVLKAIIESIKINERYNIPLDKYGVAHYGYVNPYTWEPVETEN